ncbi:SseB family protein [Weissella minor]|uniref:SseB family protein n=1 Tax=Weissella minor TaxID=1620 RepID=UPI00070F74F9|nr:SseB family protein [Weissella minor]
MELDIRNDDLIKALHTLRENQNEDTEAQYTQALLNAQFIAPVSFTQEPEPQEDGSLLVPEGTELRIVTLENEAGEMVFPVFTDMENYNEGGEWEAELPVYPYPMTIEEYLPMVFDESGEKPMGGLVLNQFTEDGMPISLGNMAYLANVLEALKNDGEMQVSSAESIAPGPLQYEIVSLADDHSDVINRLYLLWLSQGEQGSYLVVVDSDNREAATALESEFTKVFEENAGDEGSDFNLIMLEDFDVDMDEFTPTFDRNV